MLARGKLSVFLFHKVPCHQDPLLPQDIDLVAFERLLDTVISSFNVISLDDAVIALRHDNLPPNAACITFDDGYTSWINGVVPALHKRNLHATFYITTGQFNGRPLWHERIANVVGKCTLPTLSIDNSVTIPLPIQTMQQRATAIQQLEGSLKYLTLSARNERLLALEATAGVAATQVQVMPITDIRTIRSMGFGVGAHTNDHPILVYCDDATAAREIGRTREELIGIIGDTVTSFAYPNGHPFADFTSRHVDMVKRAGYVSAVTTQWGVATGMTSQYQIPRFTPWGNKPLNIAWQLSRNLLTKPICVDE